ncbi:hypothetical protein LCGC14_2378640, partial [marine sediment metagenome]
MGSKSVPQSVDVDRPPKFVALGNPGEFQVPVENSYQISWDPEDPQTPGSGLY